MSYTYSASLISLVIAQRERAQSRSGGTQGFWYVLVLYLEHLMFTRQTIRHSLCFSNGWSTARDFSE